MPEAKVKIGIENSSFERGLDDIRAQLSTWKNDIRGSIAGAFTFAAASSFFNTLREEAGRINDLAARFNQTAKSIQQVSNVAKVSGTDIETLASLLEKLSLKAADGADSFAKVGINAADFVAADYQGRILMLAAAWEQSSGSAQKQADLMDLLGTQGAEILPMLSKGVEGLREEFSNVAVMSDAAVKSLSEFNDMIESGWTQLKVWIGEVAGFFRQVGAALGAVWNSGGDFTEAKKVFEAYRKAEREDAAPRPRAQGSVVTAGESKAAAEAQNKADTARAALEEQMQQLARSRMTEAEKLVDLEREKAALAAKAQDATLSEEKRLQAAQQVLRVQQEIEATNQRIQKADDAAFEKAIEDEKKTLELEERAAKMEDEQKLAAMDPAARAAELQKRQKQLYDEAAAAEQANDRRTGAQKRLDAMALSADIAKAQQDAADKSADKTAPEKRTTTPSIVSSSLAAIGGGGGVYVGAGMDPALQEARNQTNLLRQIAQNTRPASGTASAPGSSPF